MNDYIPERDAEFAEWIGQLAHRLQEGGAPAVVPPELVAAVVEAAGQFDVDLQGHVTTRAAAAASCRRKDATRRRAESLGRQVAGLVQADGSVSDSQRASLGLTVRDRTRTPIPPPSTAPQVSIDASQRLRHTLHIRDTATATRRARPRGTIGCEVWMCLVDPDTRPIDPGNGQSKVADSPAEPPPAMRMVGLATSRPRTIAFEGPDVGRTARYQLRWVTRRGQVGPWSAVATATVPG